MLELKNISYFYKSQKDKMVLDQISYQFEKGKMYAILGTSGSGKTTLLSLLAGLDSPISGEIDMNGENIEEKGLANHRKNHISLVFQNYNLIDYLTPVENVKLGGNADAEILLTQMGIDKSTRKRNVMQLSGGQQQRVAIARALASKAPVLLADEPTGNLDEDTAKDIVEIFKSLAQKRPYMFDLLPTVQSYIRYLSDKANGREAKSADTAQVEMEKLRAEADMKRSKADMAAMQLKELEGKMHRSEDVEAVTNDLVYTVRSMIMALPGRLAMDVVQVASTNEASALIRAECYKILNELANYNYDPAVYQRRVRDREGWSDVIVAADEADD